MSNQYTTSPPIYKLSLLFILLLVSSRFSQSAEPIGSFDAISNDTFIVSGWALDTDNPSESIDVHFYLDNPAGSGELIGISSASVPRADVNSVTGYPGDHGFAWVIPKQYRTGTHALYVHAIDISGDPNPVVDGSPKAIPFESKVNIVPEGFLDNIDDQFLVTGWARDPDELSATLSVHFYVNDGTGEQFVEAVTANISSEDVGNHRFSWTVLEEYRTGQYYLSAYGIDSSGGENKLLVNSPVRIPEELNKVSIGTLDEINSVTYYVRGWALDPDYEADNVEIHFYLNGPAGAGKFIGSSVASIARPDINSIGYLGDHGFNWEIPLNYRTGHPIYAYAIDRDGRSHLLDQSPKTPMPSDGNGDAQISNLAGPDNITISTTSRLAGAIDSLMWNGMEFIDSYDHGRQLQSASSFGGKGECFNPTEAGSRTFDGTGEFSTSILEKITIDENILSTEIQPAFWLAPNEMRHPSNPADNCIAINTTHTSNHRISKKVTIGFEGMPHVIEYYVEFKVPFGESHQDAVYEVVTGYMPSNFSKFYLYDMEKFLSIEEETSSFPQINSEDPSAGGGGEQEMPIILTTQDGNYAMGVFSPGLPQSTDSDSGFGRFYFPSAEAVTGSGVNKWNCVYREKGTITQGVYGYTCYVIVGSLENVETSLQQLKAHFASQPDNPTNAIVNAGDSQDDPQGAAGLISPIVILFLFLLGISNSIIRDRHSL